METQRNEKIKLRVQEKRKMAKIEKYKNEPGKSGGD